MKPFAIVAALSISVTILGGCVYVGGQVIHDSAPLELPPATAVTEALSVLGESCSGDFYSGVTEGADGSYEDIICDGGFEAYNVDAYFAGTDDDRFISVLTPFETCEELLASAHWNNPDRNWVFGSGWLAVSQSEQFPVELLAEAVKGERINFAEWACGEGGFADNF